ncbi:hypothetical protein AB0A63_37455 [Lentzea sp. NPDC042327]
MAAAEHVEIKVAWRQRNAGISHTEPVVNNELYSCANLLPYVLYLGKR